MSTGPQTEPWNVLRLLQWTTDFFKRKAFDSPRLDAEVLLATAMNCRRIELYTSFDKEPAAEVREAFRELVRRRGEGTPVAYLVGHKEFYSLEFIVNESVLIPRPETEHVVIEALDVAKRSELATLAIADIGTGSGAISIAIAKHLPRAAITAVDLSTQALEVARRNVEKHQVGDQIKLIESDLLTAVKDPSQFQIIVSNPPYISNSEYAALSPEVRDHEPETALRAGAKGTEVIEKIIALSASRLVAGGQLIVELSPMIASGVQTLAAESGLFEPAKMIKDLAGHARVISLKRKLSLQ